MIRRLALFDIDGTLLTTNGRAVEAMVAALGAVYGCRPHTDGFLMDGKTELRIVHDLLEHEGLHSGQVVQGLAEFWPRYAVELKKRVHPGEITVYMGVRELIGKLRRRSDIMMGLLTGNCPAAADIKLNAAGLAGEFAFGAYGQDHLEREALPGLALDEAERRYGLGLSGKAVAILGDTPNDILCGRPMGLRTIAVATGRFGAAELKKYRPDHLFEDFADGDAVAEAILSDGAG